MPTKGEQGLNLEDTNDLSEKSVRKSNRDVALLY